MKLVAILIVVVGIFAHLSNEQVFVIVQGRGLMLVGQEEREVGPGTLVFIPPGETHAIRNIGDERLIYVSATTPPFVSDAQWVKTMVAA